MEFKKITNKAFDTSFAYRFLYKLRNYAQHCGSPIEGIVVKRVPNEPDKVEVKLFFRTKTLLTEFKWGSIIRRELFNKEEIIVNPLVTEMTKKVGEIHEVAHTYFRSRCRTKLGFTLQK